MFFMCPKILNAQAILAIRNFNAHVKFTSLKMRDDPQWGMIVLGILNYFSTIFQPACFISKHQLKSRLPKTAKCAEMKACIPLHK